MVAPRPCLPVQRDEAVPHNDPVDGNRTGDRNYVKPCTRNIKKYLKTNDTLAAKDPKQHLED